MKLQKHHIEHTRKYRRRRRWFSFIFILIIAVMIFLPFVVIPFLLPEVMKDQADAASTFLDAWSLEISVFIAFLIYYLEKMDEIRRHDDTIISAKHICAGIAKNVINYLLTNPARRDATMIASAREQFTLYYDTIREILSEDDCAYFDQLIAMADQDARAKRHTYPSRIFRDWLKVLARSKYGKLVSRMDQPYSLLNEETYNVLQKLGVISTDKSYDQNITIFRSMDKDIQIEKVDEFLQISPEELLSARAINIWKQYSRHDADNISSMRNITSTTIPLITIRKNGEVVFSGAFDVNTAAINTGYQRTPVYDGYYKGGIYNGPGKLYENEDACEWKLSKEGYFQNGILKFGIEYGLYGVLKEGEFLKEDDFLRREFLHQGIWYDYKGGKLKEGIFGHSDMDKIEKGIEYNWIIKCTVDPARYNVRTKDFDGDVDYDLVEIVQYFGKNGMEFNIDYDFIRWDIVRNGFKGYYISDVRILENGRVEYFNIRPLKEFLEKEDPKEYQDLQEQMS